MKEAARFVVVAKPGWMDFPTERNFWAPAFHRMKVYSPECENC